MLIRDYMTPDPVTVSPATTVPEALRLMHEKNVRHLPVVNKEGALVGIVTDQDLLYASPSPATTLAVWEIPDLLSRIKVEHVMSRKVVTVSPKTPVEEAARILADNKIGGLPVTAGPTLVGIVTETDLFKLFLELLGGRRPGVRLAVSVHDAKGTLANLTGAIFDAGGNIIGLGVNEMEGAGDDMWEIVFKIQDAGYDQLVEVIKPHVVEVLNVREMEDVG